MSGNKNDNWVSAVIIDDNSDDTSHDTSHNNKDIKEVFDTEIKIEEVKVKPKRKRIIQQPLQKYIDENTSIIEIGIDEAGRGPMFGRVYAGVVVLPKDDSFDHSLMKDSKKFHSKKKIEQVAKYIK